MSEQDWNPVSWDNRGKASKSQTKAQHLQQQKRKGNVSTQKKVNGGKNGNQPTPGSGALDEADQPQKRETVSVELKKLLQQERIKAGYRTQKELATACNFKSTIIAQYENGQATPAGPILQKIERALKQKNPEFVMGTLSKAQKKGKRKS